MSSRDDLRRFYALNINHDALGLAPWRDQTQRYFCTPVDGEIFGGPGVDGIHYLLLPEDERVFCVDPGSGSPFVRPVAKDFQEFLSFLLYCRDESPLAQIYQLNKEKFHQLLEENVQNRWPGCEEFLAGKAAALSAAAEAFQLEAQDPFAKVKLLQENFDSAKLRYSDEYYDVMGLENP